MSQTQITPSENSRPGDPQVVSGIDDHLLDVLARLPGVVLAVLFGSVALGRQRPDSDLDIAVAAHHALTVAERLALIEALAERTGRPVDLIDLKVAAEPLLGQIVRHGRRLMGSDSAYGQLISRHLFEQADFMPYRSRVLAKGGRHGSGRDWDHEFETNAAIRCHSAAVCLVCWSPPTSHTAWGSGTP
jgi:uncharacterized protein